MSATPLPAVPEPATGGSWVRDPLTGALTPAPQPAPPPAPASAPTET